MSALLNVGTCCFVISIWATLQLTIMGICFSIQAVTLYEDCEPKEEFETYQQFIKIVEENYSNVALNCFIGAVVYCILIFVSLGCIHVANRKLKKQADLMEDDEVFCAPKKLY